MERQTISALSPIHVANYLRARGWHDRGPYGPYGQWYSTTIDDRTFDVVLPLVATIADFAMRMKELLNTVAEVEHREVAGLLSDLTWTQFNHVGPIAPQYPSVRERPVWERLSAVGASVPEDAWDDVPADLATNVDRYLYGTEKKPR